MGVCLFSFLISHLYLIYPLGGLLAQSGSYLSSGRHVLSFFCHTRTHTHTHTHTDHSLLFLTSLFFSFSHLNNLIMDGFMKKV